MIRNTQGCDQKHATAGLAVQEEGFEFDEQFQDFQLGNPLVRAHPEYDEAGMRDHGLTPDRYNRYVPPPAQ